jgi:phosphoribosyl-ATP pyrophosphohydrolase/phosphoribosyl-AMP cyclohydrolase
VQDRTSGEVLMVGFMNDEAWRLTRETGYVTFFSRTRNTLWMKGETSGNRLAVRQVFTDCDDDTVLVKVDREGDGNVCHTGQRSCFYTEVPMAATGDMAAGTEPGMPSPTGGTR